MKNRLWKKWMALLLAAAMTAGAAGCGSKSGGVSENKKNEADAKTEGAEAEESGKKDVTITVAASQSWIADIDRVLAKEFTEKTGIKVDFQLNPDDQYTSIVKAKLASGEGPDIFYCNGGNGMDEYMPEMYFSDLSDQPWVGRLKDWAKDAATYDGKIVGLDMWSVDGWGMLYNPDIFAKYNLTVPKTFEEFKQVCAVLQENGVRPIYMDGVDAWRQCLWLLEMTTLIEANHPGTLDKLNTPEGKFAEIPEALQATEQIKELVDLGYFGENFMSDPWDSAFDVMANGEAAMVLTYTSFTLELQEKYPDLGAETWEMFPVPLCDNLYFSHNNGGEVKVINKDSKYAEECKEFFNFMTEKENAQRYYDGKKNLVVSALVDVTVETPRSWTSMIENATAGTGMDFASLTPFYNADNVGKAFQDLYMGGRTPMEVLQKIDEDRALMFETTADNE